MTIFERPSARDIVVAVREYLDTEVLPATEGALRYHCRVAGNLLAIVERELRQGPGSVAGHGERLRELGFRSDEELAGAIREGRVDPFAGPVCAAIRATVEAELSVANPGYTALPDEGLPDEELPERGLPDGELPDRGLPDEELPERVLPDEGLPGGELSDRGLPGAGPPRGAPR